MNKKPMYVFLHGWGFNELIWGSFIKEYFHKDQTLNIAMPAYGSGSDKIKNLKQLAITLNEKILSPSVIVAWSLGGQAAMEFAAAYPKKVEALCLFCCSPSFVKRDDWSYGMDKVQISDLQKTLLEDKGKTLHRFYTLLAKGNDKEKQSIKEFLDLQNRKPLSQTALNNGLELLLNEDQRPALKKITCPTFMAFSDNDVLLDERLSADCLKLNRNIKTCMFKGAGHMPFYLQAEASANWLKEKTKRFVLCS